MAKSSPINNLSSLEATLEDYLVKKAPALPPNFKDLIVKFAPWIILISAVLILPGLLTLLGFNSLLHYNNLYFSYRPGPTYTLSLILSAGAFALEILAIRGLFAQKLSAWRFVFYASLVSAVSTLLSGNLVSALVSLIISLYVLFQVKSYYH